MLSSKSEFVQKNEIDTNLANSSPVNCVDLSRNVLEEKRKLEKTPSKLNNGLPGRRGVVDTAFASRTEDLDSNPARVLGF
jgi:hypothetical protein